MSLSAKPLTVKDVNGKIERLQNEKGLSDNDVNAISDNVGKYLSSSNVHWQVYDGSDGKAPPHVGGGTYLAAKLCKTPSAEASEDPKDELKGVLGCVLAQHDPESDDVYYWASRRTKVPGAEAEYQNITDGNSKDPHRFKSRESAQRVLAEMTLGRSVIEYYADMQKDMSKQLDKSLSIPSPSRTQELSLSM